MNNHNKNLSENHGECLPRAERARIFEGFRIGSIEPRISSEPRADNGSPDFRDNPSINQLTTFATFNKKRGFILHEAMMAVGLSMALVVGVAQLLVVVAQQRRLARQYTLATQEVGNLMEDAVSRPWIDTTSEGLASIGFSETCSTFLPEASLSVDVADEETGVRRITVQIEWQPAPERARESVRLVGWRFLAEEGGP